MRRLAHIAAAVAMLVPRAAAEPRHGLSAFGDLAYPADFRHFAWVDPDAPKGGRLVTLGTEGRITFDSLNGYILRGEPAQKLDLLFDSLMVRAWDEPDAVYGLIAATAEVAGDGMSVTFTLRPEARFADGSPLGPDDVCESFALLKDKGHPNFQVALADVASCTAADGAVSYAFSGSNVRDLPVTVATLPVFSKAWYATREFERTTLEPPLGSGPYRVKDLRQGQFIAYERRDDYWARDLPVNRGRYNFDEIRLIYFRDRTAELESLKSGRLDLREEFTAKSWATEYDLAAVADGRLLKVVLADERPSGAQGFFLNMRRAKFADRRTREALNLAFDFEWTNANLFFGAYARTQSVFENSPLKADGLPGPDELALLERWRDQVPPAAFGEPVVPPVSNGSGQDRALLREASRLLDEAGWRRDGGRRVDAAGQPLAVEFLIFEPTFERVIAPYVRNLGLIGVTASIRQVEAAQFQERLKTFDFDVIVQRYAMPLTPGIELKSFFGSAMANVQGSYNLAGLASPAVDGLIDEVIRAPSREALTVAARVLDRVLRAEAFWVPHYYKGAHTIAHWDIFGRPAVKPRYERAVFDTWWIDPAKAATVRRGP